MKERELYTAASLELHLFFLRIMKEHAVFLNDSFSPLNAVFSRESRQFETLFESLLLQAVRLYEEGNLTVSTLPTISVELSQRLKYLNQQLLILLDKFIRFQGNLLEHVPSYPMFTPYYPSLIRHGLNETKYYRDMLTQFENEPLNTGIST